MFHTKQTPEGIRIYIIRDGGGALPVALIISEKPEILVITDKDNVFSIKVGATRQIGIDRSILYAKTLDYTYIEFAKHPFEGTTRDFFQRNSKSWNLNNFRDMLFIPTRLLGLGKAILADAEANAEQLDIFDTIEIERKTGDSKIHKLFLKSLELNKHRKEVKL